MEEKINQFLTQNVDMFERILIVLWKKQVLLKEKIIFPQENKFIVEFTTEENEKIRVEVLVTMDENKQIDRVGMVYRLYIEDSSKETNYLALSFLYHCPDELELCNQYGLYTKKDIKKMKRIKNINRIYQFQLNQNLLKKNQFFIFNMGRIKEHCADKKLDELLHSFHETIEEWNHKNI